MPATPLPGHTTVPPATPATDPRQLPESPPRRVLVSAELRANPEFQSALVRIGIWLFALVYIGIGAWIGYFDVAIRPFVVLFSVYLLLNLSILASVLRRAYWEARRYLSLSLDIIAVSLAIYLVKDGFSPFYLVYIWIFVSAGARYGQRHLFVASLAAVLSYNTVLLVLSEWHKAPMNAMFHTLVLVLLPLYQASLLHKLRDATAAAERASQAKGVFLANMTHELRTPLTGVRGMADLLFTTPLTDEQREYATAIVTSANTLHALIGDILDLSKIEAARLHLERVPFDPRTPLREVCDAMHILALDKGLELICDIEAAVPAQVCGDPLRVRQILFNLVGNAVKFTEHGEVVVRVGLAAAGGGLDRAHLLLTVSDTGIGIAPHKLADIFESFSQADASTTRRYGGTGLGTTIARDLTLLMGGRIGVSSVQGAGSCFSVRLPLLMEPSDPPPAIVTRDGPPPLAPDLSGQRVLIIESNATLRDLVGDTCAALGADCVAVPSVDLLSAAAETAADLVILADTPARLDLPAALAVLAARLGREPPTLCLTYRQRRAGLGQRRCLNKPFLRADLISALAALRQPAGTAGATCCGAPATPPPAVPGLRVLVAEDSPIAARVISGLLGKQGAVVTLVENGRAALEAALRGGFDLAFVDLHMPVLDGIGFTRALRVEEQGTGGRLPVLALTANACEDVRLECLATGMDGFLSKPVDPAALRAALLRFGVAGSGP